MYVSLSVYVYVCRYMYMNVEVYKYVCGWCAFGRNEGTAGAHVFLAGQKTVAKHVLFL